MQRTIASILLALLGCSLYYISSNSIEPVLVAVIFFLVGILTLKFTALGGRYEIDTFVLAYSICLVWAAIGAIYINYFNDAHQLNSDAGGFFELASGKAQGLTVEQIGKQTEGSAAVVMWRTVYDLFSIFGFEKKYYIGVILNVFLISVTGVVAMKISKELYGRDESRLQRTIIIFSFCGLFWLFASSHLRDASVLLSVTVLAYFWVRYLSRQNIRNLMLTALFSAISFIILGLLRKEFLFVPFAMFAAGIISMTFNTGKRKRPGKLFYLLALLALLLFIVGFSDLQQEMSYALVDGHEGYKIQDDNSLGSRFIVNAPLPIRLVLGSVYLYVFPIPVWAGFQLNSVYHLLKSVNAVYMYIVAPLFARSIYIVIRYKRARTSPAIFLILVVIGFTLAIAGTSLETRHLGALLVPFIVASVLPDLSKSRERGVCRRIIAYFVASILFVHVAWAAIKFI